MGSFLLELFNSVQQVRVRVWNAIRKVCTLVLFELISEAKTVILTVVHILICLISAFASFKGKEIA